MNWLQKISQMRMFYHGTPSEINAQKIFSNGLEPQFPTSHRLTTPIKGLVYLTPSISYALIYALGGNMAGHDLPFRFMEGSRYGYVFGVNEDKLSEIQPDEDSIGEMISKKSGPTWLNDLAKRIVAPSRLRRVMDGEYAYWASVGKQILRVLDKWQKSELLNYGGHIAHRGKVIPDAAWKVDKMKSKQFSRDGKNFFEIAERIK